MNMQFNWSVIVVCGGIFVFAFYFATVYVTDCTALSFLAVQQRLRQFHPRFIPNNLAGLTRSLHQPSASACGFSSYDFQNSREPSFATCGSNSATGESFGLSIGAVEGLEGMAEALDPLAMSRVAQLSSLSMGYTETAPTSSYGSRHSQFSGFAKSFSGVQIGASSGHPNAPQPNLTGHTDDFTSETFNTAEALDIVRVLTPALYASMSEWVIDFSSLILLEQVGAGTSGQVFRAFYQRDTVVAVKRL